MREHIATSYEGEKFVAAYRRGTLIVVRLKDGQGIALDVRETNEFRRALDDAEFGIELDDPIDVASRRFEFRMRKHKALTYAMGVITIHTQHLTPRIEA